MKVQSSSCLSIQQQSEQRSTAATLTVLPNEILLYILKQFLNLNDLWRLLQVSRTFRIFALHTIYRRWKIELSPESTMKVQCRAALVALEALSCQLSTQTRMTPFAYQTSYLSAGHTNPAAASSFVSASSEMPDPAASTTTAAVAAAGLLDQRRPVSTRSLSPYYYYYDDDDDEDDVDDDDEENLEEDDLHPQRVLLSGGSRSIDNNSNNTNDNSSSTGSHVDDHGNSNDVVNQEEDEEYDEEYDEEVEEVIIDQQQQQQQQQMRQEYHQHQRDNTNKLFHYLMRREEKLHQRIVSGISSYKHKYVLIEDIDIRNRIRSAVDVIFHHAVFVTALSRPPVRLACTHASSNNRALAAMMVRLLTRLDMAFPACCREITFTLADNIKAFLEYTGYKLMSLSKTNKSMTRQEGEILYSMIFGPVCQSSAICNLLSSLSSSPPSSSSTTTSASNNNSNSHNTTTTSVIINNSDIDYNLNNHSQHINNNNNLQQHISTSSISPKISSKLVDTLHSISACFDLMGAAFIGKILSENHVECAVQRACELLSDSYLRPIKRALLVDLLEGWLTIKRGLIASELCRWVRTEIERCDEQSSTSSLSPMRAATVTATTMRTTSSLYPPLSDLVSLANLPSTS